MNKFVSRVQCPSLSQSDYESLCQEMQKHQFVPDIVPNGKKVALSGSYIFRHKGKESIAELSNLVTNTLSRTGQKFSFTIIKEKPVYEY